MIIPTSSTPLNLPDEMPEYASKTPHLDAKIRKLAASGYIGIEESEASDA